MAAGLLKEPTNIWGFLSLGWPYIGALSVVWLTHILARRREIMAIKDKAKLEQEKTDREQAAELCFIGSQLIFILESFAVKCTDVAIDKGKKKENDDPRAQVVIIPGTEIPEISLAGVEGNWRVLQAWDMYRIMELPGMLLDARIHIANSSEHLFYGADSAELLRIRARYTTPLGLRASSLARRLRQQCGFPESPLSEGPHSVTLVLLKERKRHVMQGLSELTESAI
ncbi:hypothetical protein [Kosakonia sp. YIM B13611]|uniref:hypothetical protein n=1 Tax=unclassified Kosakonia TaxID=2632876 RepID=UPI0036AED40D